MINVIYHKNRTFLLPQSFAELTARQFLRLAPLMYSGGDEVEEKVRALRILSGLSTFRWCLLPPDAIRLALPLVDWLFDAPQITAQLLPVYKGFYGPEAEFDNLKMKEFHFSEMYYRQVLEEEDETEALNNLVAVLYRPEKKWVLDKVSDRLVRYDKKRNPDGDIRLPFNHNELPFYARQVARWPLAVKQAIFLWYDSCRQQLEEANPLVFKEPSSSGFVSQFDTGYYGVMRALAGDKLGTVDRIEEMYVHTAMLELGLIKEEEKQMEQQLKAQRRGNT